jgi:hypothetical protein
VRRDQPLGVGVHKREDDLVQVPAYDLAHPVRRPPPAQLAHLGTDAFHPLVVGAVEPEQQLRYCGADGVGASDQAVAVERRAERQGARPRDDRFVQVKECGRNCAIGLDGTAHDPAA